MKFNRIIQGDALTVLKSMPDEIVNCVVTSPPYWGLRDYGVIGQLGLEPTPDEYVDKMVLIFREVRRVLRDDGTLWLNMGDSYSAGTRDYNSFRRDRGHVCPPRPFPPPGLKPKNLVGIPWRIAFALQADGWYLRQDIIWHKPNPMPEAVKDRPTKSHEYLLLFSKSRKYYYDNEAIMEPVTGNAHPRGHGINPKSKVPSGWDTGPGGHDKKVGRYPRHKQNESYSAAISGSGKDRVPDGPVIHGNKPGRDDGGQACNDSEQLYRNKRSVWTIPTQASPEAHFATFPEALVEPCILAGSPADGVVLDPFMGSGTVALVARRLSCKYLGIELNPEYIELAARRLSQDVMDFEGE